LMRQAIPNKEDLWNFGPFTFLNIPRDVLRLVRHAQMSWELLPLLACVGLELGRVALAIATNRSGYLLSIHTGTGGCCCASWPR
jgi:hypothetical protein